MVEICILQAAAGKYSSWSLNLSIIICSFFEKVFRIWNEMAPSFSNIRGQIFSCFLSSSFTSHFHWLFHVSHALPAGINQFALYYILTYSTKLKIDFLQFFFSDGSLEERPELEKEYSRKRLHIVSDDDFDDMTCIALFLWQISVRYHSSLKITQRPGILKNRSDCLRARREVICSLMSKMLRRR